MRQSVTLTVALALAFATHPALTQDNKPDSPPAPEHFYKLDYRVISRAEGGASVGDLRYTESVATTCKNGQPSQIRSGDKIPIPTGASQFQYIDVGTNIDTRDACDTSGEVSMWVTADLSTAVKEKVYDSSQPLIRRTNWSSRVTVPIGKPTIIFSSDNVSDKGRTELELTATPIH